METMYLAEAQKFTDAQIIMQYIYGGKSTFTISDSGTHFTYRVTTGKPNPKYPNSVLRFVALLNGPDNDSNYAYFGYIKNNTFVYGREKARVPEQAPSVRGFIQA